MNRNLVVAGCYLVAMTFFIYAIANPDVAYGNDAAYLLIAAALGLLHLGAGWFATRWWVILLPILPVLIAIPAGYPEKGREPFLIWMTLADLAPFGSLLIAVGFAARRTLERRRGNSFHADPDGSSAAHA